MKRTCYCFSSKLNHWLRAKNSNFCLPQNGKYSHRSKRCNLLFILIIYSFMRCCFKSFLWGLKNRAPKRISSKVAKCSHGSVNFIICELLYELHHDYLLHYGTQRSSFPTNTITFITDAIKLIFSRLLWGRIAKHHVGAHRKCLPLQGFQTKMPLYSRLIITGPDLPLFLDDRLAITPCFRDRRYTNIISACS